MLNIPLCISNADQYPNGAYLNDDKFIEVFYTDNFINILFFIQIFILYKNLL